MNPKHLLPILLLFFLACSDVRDKKLKDLDKNISDISVLSEFEKESAIEYLYRLKLKGISIDSNLTLNQLIQMNMRMNYVDSVKKVHDSIELSGRLLSLVNQIPSKQKYNHPHRLKSEYDKFKDMYTLSLDRVPLTRTLELHMFVTDEGKALESLPMFISCTFMSNTEDWQYLHSHDLTFLIDDTTRFEIKTSREGSVGRGYVLEFISFSLPIDKFLRIVNAKTVEIQLFTTEFKLNPQALEAFKDFASNFPKIYDLKQYRLYKAYLGQE